MEKCDLAEVLEEISALLALFESQNSKLLIAFALEVFAILSNFNFVITGDIAYSVYSEPRATRYLDIIVLESEFKNINNLLEVNGFVQSRISSIGADENTTMKIYEFGLRERYLNLIVCSKISDWVFASANEDIVNNMLFKVISIESLIIVKLFTSITRDFSDILESLITKANLDLVKIKVEEFNLQHEFWRYKEIEEFFDNREKK